MIPYLPDDPDTYKVPPELAHIMVYDKDAHALRLISSVTAKEARSIFERESSIKKISIAGLKPIRQSLREQLGLSTIPTATITADDFVGDG